MKLEAEMRHLFSSYSKEDYVDKEYEKASKRCEEILKEDRKRDGNFKQKEWRKPRK
jgi:hypothetical protein